LYERFGLGGQTLKQARELVEPEEREREREQTYNDNMTSACIENINGSCKLWHFCGWHVVYHVWDLKTTQEIS